MKRIPDLVWAPIGEALLLLLPAALGFWIKQPLIFASLGPTAYELIEQPRRPSARPYNILAGHLAGIASAFASIYIWNAWNTPGILAVQSVPAIRIGTVVLATALTVLITLLIKATQPAALSTAILISSGVMQTRRDALAIILGVLMLTLAGIPLRELRLRAPEQQRRD